MDRDTELVLGSGKLFFDRFDENGAPTGEFYIGNTTSLTYSTSEEKLEHFSSDTKERERDRSITTRSDATIGFTTDDIVPQNLAMMFKGEAETLVTAAAAQTENIVIGKLGRWYQLGVSDVSPSGVRKIANFVVNTTVPVAVVPNLLANYEVDLDLARVFIPEGGVIEEGETIKFDYDVEGSSRTVIIGKADQITGALRYIADNAAGDNMDHYWPKVDISPDGDYEFKGDSWNEMSFSGEVLSAVRASGTRLAKHYVDGRPAAV